MTEESKPWQKKIGARLRQAREAVGMSRIELAKEIGLSEGSSLYKYEAGKRALSIAQVARAATVLNVSTDAIIFGRTMVTQLKPSIRVGGAARTAHASSKNSGGGGAFSNAVRTLLTSTTLGGLTAADLDAIEEELSSGRDVNALDLEFAVHVRRTRDNPSEQANREMNDCMDRRMRAAGGVPVKKPRAADNDTGVHKQPRKERRKRS